jgi:hypothetical protein
MSDDPHHWPDLDWREVRILKAAKPAPPLKDWERDIIIEAPTLFDRRPELTELPRLQRMAPTYLHDAGIWSA